MVGMRIRNVAALSAAMALSLLSWSCILPDLEGFGAKAVKETHLPLTVVALASGSPQITLHWQPPAGAVPGSIWRYLVYYRRVGMWLTAGTTWSLLAEMPASGSPDVVVDRNALGDGVYEFAVTAIGAGGESAVHRSSDATAEPATGWVLKWHDAP
jgi:hypothetical protein